jgi:hypothetical protein
MRFTRSYLLPAIAALCFIGAISQASAYPLAISLPSHAIPTPPNPAIPVLLGSWHDGKCLILPPGVIPFEAVSDTLTFRSDGTFTQEVNKATGIVRSTGRYTVNGSHLTLNYLFGTLKPVCYDFSRKGDLLLLQPADSGKDALRTLSRCAP